MNVAVTAACFLAAVLITLSRGAGSAFALLYLPAVLLLSQATSVHLPVLPDAKPSDACIYGILIGGFLGGRRPRLRPSSLDYVIVLLWFAYVISAVLRDSLYTGVSVFGGMGLSLVAPYFIVRCTLERKRTQREALFMLVATIAIIAFFALIEWRLWPYTFLRQLNNLGIGGFTGGRLIPRFGFFRSVASFSHPIDLGICAALVLAAIFILANRCGVGTRNAWIRLGLGMALVAWLLSLSFTPYLGLAAGLCLYLVLSTVPSAKRFLTVGVATLIALGFIYTAYVASTPLQEIPVDGSTLSASLWARHTIIKLAWEPAATAGAFGWGIEGTGNFGIRGFDNAYLLITTQRGWVPLGLWLALPLCLAATVSRALRRARSRSMVRSILAGFSASIGVMIAMFTVWLGFVYSLLLPVIIALTVNAAQAAAPVRRTSRRPGFPLPAETHGSGSSRR